MDFLRHLFTELHSEHSYYLYTWMIGSFLIGWIARYFLARNKQKTVNALLDKSKLELKHVSKQHKDLEGKFDLKEADYKKASLELKDKNILVESLGTEKRQIDSRLKSTLGDYEKLKVENTQTTARLEELNDQILGLRTKNSQLNTEIQQSNQTINQYADTQSSAEEQQELRNIIKRLQAENSSLKKQPDSNIAASATTVPVAITNEAYEAKLADAKAEIAQLEEGNAALNTSILQLIEQNDALKAQVDDLNQYESGNDILNSTISQLIEENDALKVNTPTEANAVVSAIPTTTSSEELDTEQAKAEIRAAIGKQISAVAASEKDDLKKINGIGPFIEEKLNDLGIYSFHQVSQLDGLLPVLTSAIEFFPGRIERDEWIGQADRLAFMKKSSSSRRSVSATTSAPDEHFTTEKTAVQEKIIVGNKPIKRVIRRAPIRRVIKAKPSTQSAESNIEQVKTNVEPKVGLPPLPAVPPTAQVTPTIPSPPPSSAIALKTAVSRKIVVPPVVVSPTTPVVEDVPTPVVDPIVPEMEIPTPIVEEASEAIIETKVEEAEIPAPVAEEIPVPVVAETQKPTQSEESSETTGTADDLRKIEGIGPKLSKVLNAAGIVSFQQLAAKSTSELQDILDQAGPRYRIARPNSWPRQAELAAAGDWTNLKELQDKMKGGILPD